MTAYSRFLANSRSYMYVYHCCVLFSNILKQLCSKKYHVMIYLYMWNKHVRFVLHCSQLVYRNAINYCFILPCISTVDISYFMMVILLSLYTVAEDFTDIFHSLDIWHKAKSIRKCIQKVFFELSILDLLVLYPCTEPLCML